VFEVCVGGDDDELEKEDGERRDVAVATVATLLSGRKSKLLFIREEEEQRGHLNSIPSISILPPGPSD
jgi:hypothetical protein